jgi:hypothetical protein
MPVAFSVKVSGDPPCRVLAIDVARRFFELAGAEASQVAACGKAVAAAIDAVADGDRLIDLAFSQTGSVVEVEIACGSRSERCQIPLRA